MVELIFICGGFGFIFVVIKHLIDKAAYKRKIARNQAEIEARRVAQANSQKINPSNKSELMEYDCGGYTVRVKFGTEHTERVRFRTENKSDPPSTRKHAKPEIDKFLDVKRKTQIIVFDVETNGLNSECSVLSCSAIKYEIHPSTYEMTELGRFNRYYYPRESFNPQAIAVNGLTKEVLAEKRLGVDYPEHFHLDNAFEIFSSDAKRFIAHNISFDTQFIPFIANKKKLCTMKTNMDIVAAGYLQWKREWKWPKLSETAVHYGIPFNESELHNSMTDTEITAQIFFKMLEEARK
jgi:DNA polymerase III subunit epsilon